MEEGALPAGIFGRVRRFSTRRARVVNCVRWWYRRAHHNHGRVPSAFPAAAANIVLSLRRVDSAEQGEHVRGVREAVQDHGAATGCGPAAHIKNCGAWRTGNKGRGSGSAGRPGPTLSPSLRR